MFLDAKTESDLTELDDDEALELLQSIGLHESGLTTLARVAFDTLGLQTYLTAGPRSRAPGRSPRAPPPRRRPA